MDVKEQKVLRFSVLVECSGRPEPATLWTSPEKDPIFSKAIDQNRVLTIIQRNVGSKADYGLVGFFKVPLATYLIFPKTLPNPRETKVIGIKYDQVAEATPRGRPHNPKLNPVAASRVVKVSGGREREPTGIASKSGTARKPKSTAKPERAALPPTPKLHQFAGQVELVARQVVPLEVEARSFSEATKLLKAKASEVKLDPTAAVLTRRLKRKKI